MRINGHGECCRRLDNDVARIHFYTLNRSDATRTIFDRLGVPGNASLRFRPPNVIFLCWGAHAPSVLWFWHPAETNHFNCRDREGALAYTQGASALLHEERLAHVRRKSSPRARPPDAKLRRSLDRSTNPIFSYRQNRHSRSPRPSAASHQSPIELSQHQRNQQY